MAVRPALRFWGSAAGVSIAFAALVPVLFPFRAIGLDPVAERERVWLLVVFTAGVMLILFGTSALLGGLKWIGVRDVLESGGVRQALERRGKPGPEDAYTRNFALWCVVEGGMLIAVYFVLWLALR